MDKTHSKLIGYLFWIFGFIGLHRFYTGRKITGAIWFFTLGLLFIGWIVDLFLVPSMVEQASRLYRKGSLSFDVCWLLLVFLGVFGVHRMYMGKWISGIVYLLTLGIFGLGVIYDFFTLNEQISDINQPAGNA